MRTALLMSGIFLVFGGTGFAETWKGIELRLKWMEAAWGFGPLKVQPMIKLTDAGYDTNVFHSPYDPVEDYTFTAGPAFEAYLRAKKKLIVSFYGSPRYVHYFETKRERTWNYYLNGDVNLLLNRFFISAGGSYTDARERWNTEIYIRPRRRERSVRASLLWQPSKRTSFSAGIRRSDFDYEDIEYERFWLSERLNRIEDYANFTVYYQIGARTKLIAELELGYFDFENPASLRDSRSRAFSGGFEFSPTGRIRGSVRLGYKLFEAEQVEGQNYEGLVGDTAMRLRLTRLIAVRASYRRDVRFSLWYGNVYFLENRAGAGLSIYVTRDVRLDYDYYQGRNEYPEAGGLLSSSDNESRLDEYTVHSTGIYFRLKQDIGIGLVASRWVRDANIYWATDKRDFIGINLIYDF